MTVCDKFSLLTSENGQKYQEKLMLMKTHEKLDNKNQRGSESVVYSKVLIKLSNN